MTKKVVWVFAIVAVVAGLAYPKLRPLWPGDAHKGQAVTGSGERKGGDQTPEKKSAGRGAPGDKSGAPLRVSTFLVVPAAFTETISATGTVLADEGVELQAEINGKVVSINFVEGAAVKKGDLLVKLNDADLRANMDRYRYSKHLAEVRFRRYEQLLAEQMVSQDDYDNVLSEMNVQQSFIDLYQAQIEKTEIRAPFDGVVGLRYVSVGAFVNATTRIATLQRLSELKIDFAVPEKYLGRIKVGTQISFSVAGGLQKYTARISALDPRIDSGTRTLLVRAICPNNDNKLRPGAFTNVSIPLEQLASAVLVPAEAVIAGLDEKNVFVMKDGLAERRAVETGSRTATQVHIISGLQAGDQLITSGLQQMHARQPVESLTAPHTEKHDPGTKATEAAGAQGIGADRGTAKPQSSANPALASPLDLAGR